MTGRAVFSVRRTLTASQDVLVDAPADIDQSVDDWIATWPEDAS